jgi:hypothetical protein
MTIISALLGRFGGTHGYLALEFSGAFIIAVDCAANDANCKTEPDVPSILMPDVAKRNLSCWEARKRKSVACGCAFAMLKSTVYLRDTPNAEALIVPKAFRPQLIEK